MLIKDLLSFLPKKIFRRGGIMGPRNRALELYSKYFDINENIKNNRFITDLDYILEKLNIDLYSVNMEELFPNTPNPKCDVSACIKKVNDKYVIYVNENNSLVRQRFSIAHEIGHFYLGHLNNEKSIDIYFRNEYSSFGIDKSEVEANNFASTLLMPKKMVIAMYEVGFSSERMANLFGVSYEAMKYRLESLNLK